MSSISSMDFFIYNFSALSEMLAIIAYLSNSLELRLLENIYANDN